MFGRKRCQHRWVDVGEPQYTPPRAAGFNLSGVGMVYAEDMLYGFTIQSQRCTICMEPRTVKMTGHFNPGSLAAAAVE